MNESSMAERTVSAHIEADLTGAPEIFLAVAVSAEYERVDETLTALLDGNQCSLVELAGPHGARFHLIRNAPAGRLIIDYRSTVVGKSEQASADDMDRFRYLRPSRYCESDKLAPIAQSVFGSLAGPALVDAVMAWTKENLTYVLGSSDPTDGAVSTFLERQGVCRDYAHLTVALLRASDLPARVVSVYAPGLEPMDFHSVVEVCLDGLWSVIDPTGLAPRLAMVRIATGVDSSETAFLTTVGGTLTLTSIEVGAIGSPEMMKDNGTRSYLW